MARLEVHLQDSNGKHKEVHEWIDELSIINGRFNQYHRKHRHHWEGIIEGVRIFGEQARSALEQHIFRDCGHIPMKKDYELQKVNFEGRE